MNFTDKLNARIGLAVGAETFQKLTIENLFNDWLNGIDWAQLKVEFPKELVEKKLAKGIDGNTLPDLVKVIDQYYFDQYKKAEDLHLQKVVQWHDMEMEKTFGKLKN